MVCTAGRYDTKEGAFFKKGPSLGFTGGVPLLVDLLSAMQDLTYTLQLPVSRTEPIQLYRDARKGQVCSSAHPAAVYNADDIERSLEAACKVPLPPEAVILVDTGSGALTADNMRILKPYLQAWGAPVFLLSLGQSSLISATFTYAAIVRQSYCSHDQLCTCHRNRLYIHDTEIAGFCNTNSFHACSKNSKAPCMGLGEMAMSYIVSEYVRDVSLKNNLEKSLTFLKHAFESAPAEELVSCFGRGMVKEFTTARRK